MPTPLIANMASAALSLGLALGASTPANAAQHVATRVTPSSMACPIPSLLTFAERVVATLLYGTTEPCEPTAGTRSIVASLSRA